MEEKKYRIVQVTLESGRKLYGAKNGDANFYDLNLDKKLKPVNIPKEKIEFEEPFALDCVSEKPETTLETFYTEIILRGLISTLPLKACVIVEDAGEFQRRLGQFQSYKEMVEIGGVTIDELIVCRHWEFLARIAGNFVHLPDSVRMPAIALVKKEAPQYAALTKIVLSA